jgi:hypothetical protein
MPASARVFELAGVPAGVSRAGKIYGSQNVNYIEQNIRKPVFTVPLLSVTQIASE